MTRRREQPPAIYLMGPTASGKTELAIELHRRLSLDIISVDSAQVYRGMDIGTAKPDAATLAIAPHALIDIRDPCERYSAAEFRADALAEMQRITAAGRVPLLAGGTMLYFKALSEGLATMPSADPELRRQLEREALEHGWPALHARLAAADPEAARRIHRNDPQRIQRALEVITLSGRTLSELQRAHRAAGPGYEVLRVVACPQPRAVLHRRIEQRFDAMLAEGFLDEVRALRARADLDPSMPSMRCVGYRQAWAHLDGAFGAAEMRLRAIYATRQLAKRQVTWLRRETAALWYDPLVSNARETVIGEITRFLESGRSRTNV